MLKKKEVEKKMFNPDLNRALKNNVSRYSLVMATAKRARQLADIARENGEFPVEKPVTRALNEIVGGKFKIVERK